MTGVWQGDLEDRLVVGDGRPAVVIADGVGKDDGRHVAIDERADELGEKFQGTDRWARVGEREGEIGIAAELRAGGRGEREGFAGGGDLKEGGSGGAEPGLAGGEIFRSEWREFFGVGVMEKRRRIRPAERQRDLEAVGEELGLDEARVDVVGAEREGEEEASYGGCELAREAPRKSREQARSYRRNREQARSYRRSREQAGSGGRSFAARGLHRGLTSRRDSSSPGARGCSPSCAW